MTKTLWWRFWLPPVLYLILIFTVSSFSSFPHPEEISLDLLHYPEYAILALLLARALDATHGGTGIAGTLLFAFAFSVMWGITDEFHQAFVPGRVPDLNDLYHDAVGALAGCLLYLAWRALARRLSRPKAPA